MAIAAGAALALPHGADGSGTREVIIAIVLAVMLAGAIRFPLQISPQMQHDMGAAPIVAAIVLLPPPAAFVACLFGAVAGELTKKTRRPAQVAFNSSVTVLGVALAAAWKTTGPLGDHTESAVDALLMASTYYVVTAVLTEGIVSLQLLRRPFRQWWRHNSEPFFHESALLVIGGLTALVVQASPSALPLMSVPCIVIFRSLRFQQRRVRSAEASRAIAEEERSRLTTIVEATPDFVATADAEGRVLYVNEGGRTMLGLDREASTEGLMLSAVLADWDRHAAEAVVSGNWSGESEVIAGDGPVPVSQVVLAHRADDGRVAFLSTVARDIRERKQFESQLVHIADHDALTGLLNRRRFDDEIDRHVTRASQGGQGGALLFMDLDGFKAVNDSYGHEAGDRLLAGLAKAMGEQVIRRGDVLARLGGDEFAIILPWASAESAEAVARRLVSVVGAFSLKVGPHDVSVGASTGIALFPQHGVTPREVVGHADAAMYEAKQHKAGIMVWSERAA